MEPSFIDAPTNADLVEDVTNSDALKDSLSTKTRNSVVCDPDTAVISRGCLIEATGD